jgi:hypothetical protein
VSVVTEQGCRAWPNLYVADEHAGRSERLWGTGTSGADLLGAKALVRERDAGATVTRAARRPEVHVPAPLRRAGGRLQHGPCVS